MEFLEILSKLYKIRELTEVAKINQNEHKKSELKTLLRNLYKLIRGNTNSAFFEPLSSKIITEFLSIYKEDIDSSALGILSTIEAAHKVDRLKIDYLDLTCSPPSKANLSWSSIQNAALKNLWQNAEITAEYNTLDNKKPEPESPAKKESLGRYAPVAKKAKTSSKIPSLTLYKNKVLSQHSLKKFVDGVKTLSKKSVIIQTLNKIDRDITSQMLTHYSVQSWNLIRKFSYGGVEPSSIKFSEDSKKIAIGFITWTAPEYNVPHNLRMIDLCKKTDTNLHGHYNTVSSGSNRIYTTVSDVEFVDKNILLSCSYDKAIKLWDTKRSFPLASISTPTKRLNKLTVNSTKELVVCCADNGLFFNKLTTSSKTTNPNTVFDAYYRTHSKREVNDVLFNPTQFYNSQLYCAYSKDITQCGSVSVVDVISLKEKSLIGIKNEANCLDVSPQGDMLAVGTSDDESIYVFDIRQSHNLSIQAQTNQKDMSLAKFSNCGTYIASCAENNSVIIFDLRFLCNPLYIFHHNDDVFQKRSTVNDGLWTRNGLFYSAGGDGIVNIWDVKCSDPLINSFKEHDGSVSCIQMSKDEDMLMVGCDSGTCFLYSTKNMNDLKECEITSIE